MYTFECSNTAKPFFRHYSKLKKEQRARVEVMDMPDPNSSKTKMRTYICQVCGTENVQAHDLKKKFLAPGFAQLQAGAAQST